MDTVVLRSTRVGNSSRVNRYWTAAEFGYVPVKAERTNKEKIDLTLRLIEFKTE